eukprot:6834291-Prymnesium_polylepis.1
MSTRCVQPLRLTYDTSHFVALMLRPSVSLAVRLQMYVEARTGATPDIGWGASHACIMYCGCDAGPAQS